MNGWIMAVIIIIALGAFSFSMYRRIMPLFIMRYEVRWDNIVERITKVFLYAFGQKRFWRKWEAVSAMSHIMIFWGFLTMSIRALTMMVMGVTENPEFHLPLFGGILGQLYAIFENVFIIFVFIGVTIGIYRRLIVKPTRLTLSAEAVIILFLIMAIVTSDAFFDAAKFNLGMGENEHGYAFVGTFLASVLSGTSQTANTYLLYSMFWVHVLAILSFLNFLPYGKHFHVVTSIPNTFLFNLAPAGRLAKMDLDIEGTGQETEEEPFFGVSKIEDFSWKRAMDMYTCTECGRCTAGCPAWLTQKPLDPKKLHTEERDHLKHYTDLFVEAARLKLSGQKDAAKKLLEETERKQLIGDVITEDVIWSCTTCRHCQYSCPVTNEHVDNIVDLRRYLVQVESKFPKELTQMFKGMEQNGNPWNIGFNKRQDWTQGLEVPIMAELADEDRAKLDFLFWVGCAGSFDDRNVKISKALVKIFKSAGLKFAILGNEETCTGDSARRAGNEFLFQVLAKQNVETLNGYGVKKIVTACPHCFNTLKHEYPDFGGKFEVAHHSVLIADLIKDGKIKLDKGVSYKITYHDPCYLGRYNSTYDEPRTIIDSIPGTSRIEMEKSKDLSFCCGGGGARWSMEEHGTRINQERAVMAANTGANLVAVACPFCILMLKDGIGGKNLDDKIDVKDISELVAESIIA